MRLSGGVSRSAFFAQLLADVLGRPVEVTAAHEASALGAALCAGVGAGVFASLAEAAARQRARRAALRAAGGRRARSTPSCYAAWSELREARAASDAAGGRRSRCAASPARRARPAPPAATGFRPRILVAADLDETGLAALREIGDVEYQSFRTAMRLLTGPSLARALAGVQIFVTEVDVVNAEALVEADDLRVIAVCRGDAVNVDLEACTALGIPVLHTPGRNADAVADLTLAFLLMLARKLAEANAFLREPGGKAGDMGRMGRAFTRLQGRELWRKTVGLVGLGAVGRKVVERLRPFGARCLVHDPVPRRRRRAPRGRRARFARRAARGERLRDAARRGDRALARPDRGGASSPGCARARAWSTPRAPRWSTRRRSCSALESGQLAGAALDVFSVEPPAPDHPLLAAAERDRDAPRRRQHRRRRGAPGPHRRARSSSGWRAARRRATPSTRLRWQRFAGPSRGPPSPAQTQAAAAPARRARR